MKKNNSSTRKAYCSAICILLLLPLAGYYCVVVRKGTGGSSSNSSSTAEDSLLLKSIQHVRAAGLHVCRPAKQQTKPANVTFGVSQCYDESLLDTSTIHFDRLLQEEMDDSSSEDESFQAYMVNAFFALLCVGVAAMAAGLTLGMLGLDPLLLLIKERAATDLTERASAVRLLPVVSQHHRLLVTLLLMNAVANEALPLFLEKLVPPAFAVLVSVTLVLFFGEIIPSAIFTGPNQLQIASAMVPVVKTVMWVLYPLAGPIAALLDYLLHDHSDDDSGTGTSAAYTRGELSALIRIQYEERVSAKQRKHTARKNVVVNADHVGALDFTRSKRMSLRAAKHQVDHEEQGVPTMDGLAAAVPFSATKPGASSGSTATSASEYAYRNNQRDSMRQSIHRDEVTMVEGALQMQTKVAIDVFTPMRRVFSIPSDMLLTERNMVKIYSSGFTRIPVHEPGNKTAIVGILQTKMLIVVNPDEERPVNTLPLRSPRCVSPAMPLVDVLNIMQSGGKGSKGGHLALVCARPSSGEKAFGVAGESLPETAGLMGIITLEDVLEMLLQEQIYDEMDKRERGAHRLAVMVVRRWKRYVKRKKDGESGTPAASSFVPTMLPVVERAMATARAVGNDPTSAAEQGLATRAQVAETTALLGAESPSNYFL